MDWTDNFSTESLLLISILIGSLLFLYWKSKSGKTESYHLHPQIIKLVVSNSLQTLKELQSNGSGIHVATANSIDLSTRGWSLSEIQSENRVWMKQSNNLISVRCGGVIHTNGLTAFESIWDLKQRNEWQSGCVSSQVIASTDDKTNIGRFEQKNGSLSYLSRHFSATHEKSSPSWFVIESDIARPSHSTSFIIESLNNSNHNSAEPTRKCLLFVIVTSPAPNMLLGSIPFKPIHSKRASSLFSSIKQHLETREAIFASRGLISSSDYTTTSATSTASATDASKPSSSSSSSSSTKTKHRKAQPQHLSHSTPSGSSSGSGPRSKKIVVADFEGLQRLPPGVGVTLSLPTNTHYTPTHQYAKVCIDVLRDVMEAAAGTEQDGWQLEFRKKEIDVFKKTVNNGSGGSAAVCVKGTGRIEAPPRAVFDLLIDVTKRKTYDVMFKTGRVIDQLNDPFCKVVYLEYEALWPTAARDFCVVLFLKLFEDNTCIIAARSIAHPDCPEIKGFVRADAQVTGWVINSIPNEPMACMATYLTQVDLKGNVPSMIVAKVTTEQPLCIDLVRKTITTAIPDLSKYVPRDDVHFVYPAPAASENGDTKGDEQENGQENGQENENEKDELGFEDENKNENDNADEEDNYNTHHAGYKSDEENDYLSISEEDYNNNNSNNTSSESIPVPLSSHSQNKFYDHICSQALSDVLQESIFTGDVSPVNETSASYTSLEGTGWRIVSVEKDVVLLRKVVADSPINRFMGKGIIQCSAETVFNFVQDPYQRKVYDNMLKEAKLIRRIDENTQLIHMSHETTQCMMKHSRDFCLIARGRKEATGKYLVAGISIKDPSCPVQESVVRGEILSSGWYIEPLTSQSCMVTYLTQVDLKGGVPSRVLNVISVKQPLCIAYLRRHLEKM